MTQPLDDKRVLVTGGTGSLGHTLVRRILTDEQGRPSKVIVVSRDEAKQHEMRLSFMRTKEATDEVIYRNFEELLEFRIGDVRDLHCMTAIVRDADVIFNAAALKQVPTCEYFPHEAVQTNVTGAENIVRAIKQTGARVETVVGISTDKACKPVNVMGMTKAIQERILIEANIRCPDTRFVCVRYGNVLTSRGSVIPLFDAQIRGGGPVTITHPDMTRFLLTLDESVDTVFAALLSAHRGETYVPRVASALIVDVADVLIGNREMDVIYTGIRPGEKVHETLISDEESYRTVNGAGGYFAVRSMLPELDASGKNDRALFGEYSSSQDVMDAATLRPFLAKRLDRKFSAARAEL